MPEDIIISELSNAASIDDNAVFPFTQDNGGTPTTFKGSMSQIAGKIAEGTTYTNLNTTAKQLVPAINEIAQGGGGSVDITTAITTAAAIQSFNDGGNNIPLKSCNVKITAQQAGSGTPSPSNPRAISGFDSVNVVVSGTNLYNKATRTDDTRLNISTGLVTSGSSWCVSDYIPVKGGESYYFKLASMNSSNYGSAWYDKNKTYISGIPSNDENVNKAHTAPNDACYLRITTSMTGDYAVNYPSTITDYIEFVDSNTYTIALPETIYGGTAELVGGSGTKTLDCVDLGDLSWTMGSTNIGFYANLPNAISPISTGDINAICSCYERIDPTSTTTGLSNLTFCVSDGNITTQKRIFIRDDSYNGDVSLFVAGVTGQKLVYTLATPTAFAFAETNIPTLSGMNNIYADSGDIASLEYFNSGADDIDSLINLEMREGRVDYSLYERIAGTWIDGSTLYERTLYFNNVKLDKTDNTSELLHGISNIGSVRFVCEAYNKFTNNVDEWTPVFNTLWDNGILSFQWVVGSNSIYIQSASGVYFSASTNRSYIIKIRYTKT